jgi:hypothetical protein
MSANQNADTTIEQTHAKKTNQNLHSFNEANHKRCLFDCIALTSILSNVCMDKFYSLQISKYCL